MNELALFAGGGGGILGGHILGWRTVCAVEFDLYARNILLARQRDGFIPRFPIWDDVKTFDGKPWRGRVDVVSGGFPCQDISAAGKGAGIEGERSGLWKHMARIVGEVRPRFVWVENSPMLVHRGLAVVLADLAAMGYDARWGAVGADDAIWHNCNPCADHERKRLWICAFPNPYSLRKLQPQRRLKYQRRRIGNIRPKMADAMRFGQSGSGVNELTGSQAETGNREASELVNGSTIGGAWWATEPNLGGMVDGMAAGMDPHGANAAGDVGRVGVRISNRGPRLKAIGNGQCPQAMAIAWKILSGD